MPEPDIHVALLPGDGIGPEVARAARDVLDAAAPGRFRFTEHPFGGAAIAASGQPLPPETLEACRAADAVLLGAIGGPRWDALPRAHRPESGLLALRSALGTFANLRPVPFGADLLIVRELTGGIYFGQPRSYESGRAYNTMVYERDEIVRIAHVAFEQARRRRSHVTSVDKANVLEVSQLWREVVTEIGGHYPDVRLDHMYVDNAAMQIVQNPAQFDVIVTGNLFGDILSDLASTLAGSLGTLPSACTGNGTPIFEPVHGSAPDLTGTGRANPIGAILSGAMLLDELGLGDEADAIRRAVQQAIHAGTRTIDLGGTASCADMTAAIIAALAAPAATTPQQT
jgi:3-isopropylmalate dehydrogenase